MARKMLTCLKFFHSGDRSIVGPVIHLVMNFRYIYSICTICTVCMHCMYVLYICVQVMYACMYCMYVFTLLFMWYSFMYTCIGK